MRNKLTLILLAILLIPLIAACGGTGDQAAAPDAEQAVTQAAPEPDVAEPTEVQTEALPDEPAETAIVEEMTAVGVGETATAMADETAMAGMDQTVTAGTDETTTAGGATTGEPLKIGLVTDIGSLNDKSFNESSWNGTQQGAEAVGGEARAIETQDPNDYEQNINQFVQEGYNVIVTVGFALGEQTLLSAQANPDIHFIGVDQFQAETVPNVTGLVFEEDKAGFLAGALAALYSKSGNIGAVLSTDAVPPVWRFGEGFRAGALHVNPDINIQIVYHNDVGLDMTFNDPEWGKATALSMLDQGVDVIFGAGGNTGNGALQGVAERADTGAVAIGVDTDQYETVPEARPVLLSSAMKLLDQGVAELIQQVADGTIEGGNYTGDVGLAPFHDFEDEVTDEIRTQLDEIRQQLDDGTLETGVAPTKPS